MRPLTALAFAIPVGALVLTQAVRQRLWRHVFAAGLAGTVVVATLPIWSAQTTGDWRVSPLALYRHDYLPFDKPGFGLDTTPPALPLSAVNATVYATFAGEHQGYSFSRLPSAAVARLRALGAAEWATWRVALIPFALIGLASASAELWFAIACAIALFVGYLSYGHWPGWTLYLLRGDSSRRVLHRERRRHMSAVDPTATAASRAHLRTRLGSAGCAGDAHVHDDRDVAAQAHRGRPVRHVVQ